MSTPEENHHTVVGSMRRAIKTPLDREHIYPEEARVNPPWEAAFRQVLEEEVERFRTDVLSVIDDPICFIGDWLFRFRLTCGHPDREYSGSHFANFIVDTASLPVPESAQVPLLLWIRRLAIRIYEIVPGSR